MFPELTTEDIVTYDGVYNCSGRPVPYRSEALYQEDMRCAMQVRKGEPIQVIKERGDALWTYATADGWDTIESGMIIRFQVILADGTPHQVDCSRIRPVR